MVGELEARILPRQLAERSRRARVREGRRSCRRGGRSPSGDRRPPGVARSHGSAFSFVPMSSIMWLTWLGAPPCSRPLSAPTAPTRPEPTSEQGRHDHARRERRGVHPVLGREDEVRVERARLRGLGHRPVHLAGGSSRRGRAMDRPPPGRAPGARASSPRRSRTPPRSPSGASSASPPSSRRRSAAQAERPVRSASIGWASAPIRCSTSTTGRGVSKPSVSLARRPSSSSADGSRPFASRNATPSNALLAHEHLGVVAAVDEAAILAVNECDLGLTDRDALEAGGRDHGVSGSPSLPRSSSWS